MNVKLIFQTKLIKETDDSTREKLYVTIIFSNKLLEVKRECPRFYETTGSQYSLLFETRFKEHATGIVIGNL